MHIYILYKPLIVFGLLPAHLGELSLGLLFLVDSLIFSTFATHALSAARQRSIPNSIYVGLESTATLDNAGVACLRVGPLYWATASCTIFEGSTF